MQKIGLSHFGGKDSAIKAINKKWRGYSIFEVPLVNDSRHGVGIDPIVWDLTVEGSGDPDLEASMFGGTSGDRQLLNMGLLYVWSAGEEGEDVVAVGDVEEDATTVTIIIKDASWLKTCKKCKLLGVVK